MHSANTRMPIGRKGGSISAVARNTVLSMAVISPQPLGMIVPSSLLENGPFLPTPYHHCDPTDGQTRNHKGKKVVKLLLGGIMKRGSRGRAAARRPRGIIKPEGLDCRSSSTGSSVDVVVHLDLELRL